MSRYEINHRSHLCLAFRIYRCFTYIIIYRIYWLASNHWNNRLTYLLAAKAHRQ